MTKVRHTIRVDEVDLAAWKGAADKVGLSLSEWIRRSCNLDFFKEAVEATHKHFASPEVKSEEHPVKAVRKRTRVPVVKRSADASGVVLGSTGHLDREAITPAHSKAAKTCKHGTEKGYHCWKCGGLAVIE